MYCFLTSFRSSHLYVYLFPYILIYSFLSYIFLTSLIYLLWAMAYLCAFFVLSSLILMSKMHKHPKLFTWQYWLLPDICWKICYKYRGIKIKSINFIKTTLALKDPFRTLILPLIFTKREKCKNTSTTKKKKSAPIPEYHYLASGHSYRWIPDRNACQIDVSTYCCYWWIKICVGGGEPTELTSLGHASICIL